MAEHEHTNRLINETSPYLLQHAHNPVDWYPWGEAAFAKAREEGKPVLLSIGYSACHWCHVMEHESFENEAIAQLMNENFVNIKVDREERPDLDQIYMNAVQMMTQHGGWPMTVFLTPEAVPFYGGTYFPPEDRYNMPGFPRVLLNVAQTYRDQPDEVTHTASSLLGELRRLNVASESADALNKELLDAAYRGIIKNHDTVNGGFGSAPKFPPAMTLEFLLRTNYRTGRQDALAIVAQTARKMANGGIYDQLGGGFHRYSTDAKWLVPHFEKMLYDNALLSRFYLHYYQLTGDELANRVVTETLDYVAREMTHPDGGFYSTQDADSEGHEGKCFVWSTDEIASVLGTDEARLFCSYYDVTPAGNFEGENILQVTRSVEDVAQAEGVSVAELRDVLERSAKKLFEVREQRVKPDRDEKILTAWNGLMLASFAEAAAVLDREDYAAIAKKNAHFVLDNLRHDGLLLRTFKDGQAKLNGYLEDYAFFAEGLLTLFEVTGEFNWFEATNELTQKMISEFGDDEDGGFYFTGKSHESLIVRSKDYFDNATPSGNSVAAEVLLRLGLLTDNEDYRRRATTVLRLVAKPMQRYPAAFGRALAALDFYLSSPLEIAIIGEQDSAATRALSQVVWQGYLPNKVLAQVANAGDPVASAIPLLRDRSSSEGLPTAFLCERYTCQQPVTEPKDLTSQLSAAITAARE
jgi:uncharacterized protein YyaL (SSP411 family)